MDLKIFTWNCRGFSNRKTLDRIQGIMRYLKPNLICLVQTKTDSTHIHHFCDSLFKLWQWATISSIGLSRGIIVMWNRSIGLVTPVANTRSTLHLVISLNMVSWILSIIYNSQVLSLQNLLWKNLSCMTSLNTP